MNRDDISTAIRNGTIVQLTGFNAFSNGMRCKILRQSQKTGGLTIELVEENQLLHKGDKLHVKPYEVEPLQPRHDELVQEYNDSIESTTRELRRMVEHGLKARTELAERLLSSEIESVAKVMSWGEGVKKDLKAAFASRILVYVATGEATLEETLKLVLEQLKREVETNQNTGGSSSSYHNAVDEDRRAIRRETMDFCRHALADIRQARAMIEVL